MAYLYNARADYPVANGQSSDHLSCVACESASRLLRAGRFRAWLGANVQGSSRFLGQATPTKGRKQRLGVESLFRIGASD
jgi:hypothetical protein